MPRTAADVVCVHHCVTVACHTVCKLHHHGRSLSASTYYALNAQNDFSPHSQLPIAGPMWSLQQAANNTVDLLNHNSGTHRVTGNTTGVGGPITPAW
jgi:hypothetical protein